MKKANRNLRLVALESIVTAGILSIPIMTPFFNSIGLNQEQIALSQMIFTVVVMLLNVPTGWLADRFSRKWANIIGDFGCALTLILYSQAQDFTGVVLCETLVGVFLAFSQGVDASLLKHFSSKLDSSGELYKTTFSKVSSLQYICMLSLMLLGGPIGAIDFRLAIALSAVTFLVGGTVALFVNDDSENLVPSHRNPLKDMLRVVKDAAQNPALRLRIFAYAVAREITHGIIWVFTPLMLLAGVPLAVVSVGWAINNVAGFIGSKIAQKFATRLKEWQIFAIPILLVTIGLGVMSLHFSLATIWLYLLMGVTQGWTSATMLPLLQRHAKPSEQTSVISLARVAAQILYLPAVWLIGIAADLKTEYSMLTTLLIFVPLSLPILFKLRREKYKP
jgi:MFS family permease